MKLDHQIFSPSFIQFLVYFKDNIYHFLSVFLCCLSVSTARRIEKIHEKSESVDAWSLTSKLKFMKESNFLSHFLEG